MGVKRIGKVATAASIFIVITDTFASVGKAKIQVFNCYKKL